MADKPKKTGRQNYDWDVIKLDYISNPKSSINQISEKYGIRRATVSQKSRENGWANAKKEYLQKVSTKASTKASTKQADRLARLIDATDKIAEVLEGALKDPEQFYRQFVPETVSEDGTMISTYVDKTSKKLDTRAIKDVMQSVKMLEDINRSLHNIQKAETLNKERREDERLKIERERFEFEKSKYNDSQTTDNDIKVVIGGYEDGWDE